MVRVLPFLLLAASACHKVDPVADCEAFADAYASKAEECGQDYQTYYDWIVAETVGSTCSDVVDIRDHGDLVDTCIPWIQGLTCDEWTGEDLALDPTCSEQLRVQASE